MAGALIAGTFLGPPLAQAAAASLVTIQGSGSTSQVKVTKAGQLEETGADPSSIVTVLGNPTCNAGGFYTVPAGKALIITSVNFYNIAGINGDPVELDLLAGPSATPCTNRLASGLDTDITLTLSQNFQPGIAVPAGESLGLTQFDNTGSVEVYGYLVPKADVPAAADQSTKIPAGRSPMLKQAHRR